MRDSVCAWPNVCVRLLPMGDLECGEHSSNPAPVVIDEEETAQNVPRPATAGCFES